MEAKTGLAILLIGSVGLNIYLWATCDSGSTPPPGTECHITPGFELPVEISGDQALRYSDEYKEALRDEDKTLGGIITRSAFDAILCTEKCNAISYTFCRDGSGETGPEGNGVFVVYKGVNVTLDEESGRITIEDIGTKNYIGGYWCPPSCSPY
jgi:hypothetical protein